MLDAIRTQYLKYGTVDKIGHRTELDKPKKGRSGRSVTGTTRKQAPGKATRPGGAKPAPKKQNKNKH